MKTLVIVRHGDYDSSGLNANGKVQLSVLREALLPHLSEETVVISSSALRCLQSAELLIDDLGSTWIKSNLFFSENMSHLRLPEAMGRIEAVSADTVIIVTHCEYTQMLPQHFARHYLKIDESTFPRQALRRGAAYVINCRAKAISVVP